MTDSPAGLEVDEVIPELAAYPPSMKTEQVAQVLNIAKVYDVGRYLNSQVWPGFKVGRSWRMRRSVVQQIMLGQYPTAQPGPQESVGS